jgi:hypothetical protein
MRKNYVIMFSLKKQKYYILNNSNLLKSMTKDENNTEIKRFLLGWN